MAKRNSAAIKDKKIYRIIDANINRLREALRVDEEIVRFVLDDRKQNLKIKKIRHEVEDILKTMRLDIVAIELSRQSCGDVGKDLNIPAEFKKNDIRDILMSNLHRAEESLRVLEEFMKLFDIFASQRFKKLRFEVYTLERDLLRRVIANFSQTPVRG